MRPNRLLYSTMGLLSATTLLAACSASGGASQTWDYEVMGVHARSYVGDTAQLYADFIVEDQSVEVSLREWERWEPGEILENLRTNEDLRQAIAEAEVITYDFAFDWQNRSQNLFLTGLCGGVENQDCLREDLQQAEQDWSGILDLITELRAGSPVLLRVLLHGDWFFDYPFWNPTPEQKAIMADYYHQLQTYALQDAARRGVPVVQVFPEPYFNESGPPAEYFLTEGIRLSDEGSLALAELLRDMGYEPVTLED